MARFWAMAILTLIGLASALTHAGAGKEKEKAKEKDVEIKGTLTKDDPKDKERARTANQTKPGHMPQQPVKKDDELQPLREKSGF